MEMLVVSMLLSFSVEAFLKQNHPVNLDRGNRNSYVADDEQVIFSFHFSLVIRGNLASVQHKALIYSTRNRVTILHTNLLYDEV